METEITCISDIAAESTRLYLTLQKSVDEQIQSTGFVPSEGYGGSPHQNGSTNGTNGNSPWKCSDKQRELIEKLMDEHQLEKAVIQKLAKELFGTGEVSSLNKLQASGLIDRLIEEYGGKGSRRGTTPTGRYSNGAGRSQ